MTEKMKKTLVIPCMGEKLIKGLPLYLNMHPGGMRIARKCIEGLSYANYDNVYIAFPKEDIERYDAESLLREAYNDIPEAKFLALNPTRDAVETVLAIIDTFDIKGELVIKDINNCIDVVAEDVERGNFIAGVDLDQIGKDIYDLHKMSFIILNENDNVMDIVEKRVCSEHVGVGLYGFADIEEFVFAANQLNDTCYSFERKYISHIVSYMIGYSECVFHYVRSDSYECWNDEKSWGALQRNWALYFIDLDHLFASNFNGFESKESISILREMSERGASFIGFTVRGESEKNRMKRIFEEAGVNSLQVVFGCPVTSEKRLIRNKKDMMEFYYYS